MSTEIETIRELADQVRGLGFAPTSGYRLDLARAIRARLEQLISRWATELDEQREAKRRGAAMP